jgi:hypothetical protein
MKKKIEHQTHHKENLPAQNCRASIGNLCDWMSYRIPDFQLSLLDGRYMDGAGNHSAIL